MPQSNNQGTVIVAGSCGCPGSYECWKQTEMMIVPKFFWTKVILVRYHWMAHVARHSETTDLDSVATYIPLVTSWSTQSLHCWPSQASSHQYQLSPVLSPQSGPVPFLQSNPVPFLQSSQTPFLQSIPASFLQGSQALSLWSSPARSLLSSPAPFLWTSPV